MASLPVISVSAETYAKFNACVHCGLCLPECPTYVETQDEADSPRGRIHMMKAVLDGRVEASDVVLEHLERCLVCRACEPACPSGVEYHTLLETVRPQVAEAVLGKGKTMRNSALAWMVGHVLPYPKRVALALMPVKAARKMGLGAAMTKLVPKAAAGALEMMPKADAEGREPLPLITPAVGTHRGSVVLLRGCVGSIVSEGVNRACLTVLSANGFDVHLLEKEPCCGAMAAHANDPAGARDFAQRMVEVLAAKGGDYFISPIAGCGAQLKALDHVLAKSAEYAEKAREIVGRVRDVCEFLMQVGMKLPERRKTGGVERRVTYHDPCHLAHAQRITAAPRELLGMVKGLQLVPLAEASMCCGAAGTYSLSQPEMARRLGERKVGHILATAATEIVTANVGCALQIARHLRKQGSTVRVRHVVEVLAEAYGN